jgi:DNA invertase Pin-like site-specific DNA recombinase
MNTRPPSADGPRRATCRCSGAIPLTVDWRDLIRARTGEGRERAKARGVKMGRKPKLTPHQMKEALRRCNQGEPMRDIGKSFNVSHSTISRLAA